MRKDKGGFTLLELLVVIGIIAILISLAAVAYSTAQKSSRDSRRRTDMRAVQSALEQYYASNAVSPYTYPASGDCSDVESATYLEKGRFPVDPGTNAYNFSCDADSYCVCAELERTGGGNSTNNACNYAGSGDYYCVTNLQ